jgi:membrane protease subunit (stomatin/prohibitin family)
MRFCRQVFFVLRNKLSQASYLHIYHHTGMVLLSWGGVKWLPGEKTQLEINFCTLPNSALASLKMLHFRYKFVYKTQLIKGK